MKLPKVGILLEISPQKPSGCYKRITEYEGLLYSRSRSSGGPYFYDDDGELLVVGHHRASNSDMICFGSDCYEQHYSIGTHIEVLEDAMNAEVR